ncbi:MAG: hypothetical protein V2A79_13540 [Planctomycetota bacterium]
MRVSVAKAEVGGWTYWTRITRQSGMPKPRARACCVLQGLRTIAACNMAALCTAMPPAALRSAMPPAVRRSAALASAFGERCAELTQVEQL